jgi:DNA-binding NtrC family response regulator
MKVPRILWVDDEIDHLKPHILFLKNKSYDVLTCTNGLDAIQKIKNNQFDVVLLDENMPGLNGLETLNELKKINSELPVIMITKNEAEHIMDDAIGGKISDYLIKPVNPNQILIALKKILNTKNLIDKKVIQSYQKEYRSISNSLLELSSVDDWVSLYKKMTYWELELQELDDPIMFDIFKNQMKEANFHFSNFSSL